MNGNTVTGSYIAYSRIAVFSAGTLSAAIATGVGGVLQSGSIVFSNANNVSFGLSTQTNAVHTITARAGAVVSFIADPGQFQSANGVSNAAMSMYRYTTPHVANLTALELAMRFDFATQASTDTVSVSAGWYTMSGSTASLASSMSQSFTYDQGNANFASKFGLVALTGFTHSLTPGDYLLGIWFRNSITDAATMSALGQASVVQSTFFNTLATQQFIDGYSSASFTTGMPASINITDAGYVRSDNTANRFPSFRFFGS
jgi:hypothetical protein